MPAEILYGAVLLAAFAHALWNAMVKRSPDQLLMLSGIRLVGLVFGLLVVSLAAAPAPASWPYLLGAAAVHYVYYGFLLRAYRVGDLSTVYPLARGIAPLLVAGLAVLFIQEILSPLKLAAVALISLGILAVAFPPARTGDNGFRFALATGAAIAGYTALSGIGIRLSGAPLAYIGWLEVLTGVGMVATAMVLRERAEIAAFARAHGAKAMLAGALSVGGYLIALFAMVYLPIAAVAALRETSVIFAALLGAFALREKFGVRRSAAAGAMTAGLILLGFG